VRFLGFRDDLPQLYPAFDVYCHSSLDMASEMFPIAILRALATGLPVVATAVGGVAGMIEEGKSGYLVPADAPAALAFALARVVGEGPLRKSLGTRAAAVFAERFDAARMAERVEAVYTMP
jgi:glycosyltransferase involved in cell wall biosynthesis